MKRRLQNKEKEARRRNIIIKELNIEKGGVKGEVEKMLKEIRMQNKFERVKRIRKSKEKW